MKKFEEKLKKLNVEVIKHPIGDTHYLLKNQVESIVRKADKEINWLHNLLDDRNEEVLQTVKLLNEAQPEIPEFVATEIEEKIADLVIFIKQLILKVMLKKSVIGIMKNRIMQNSSIVLFLMATQSPRRSGFI